MPAPMATTAFPPAAMEMGASPSAPAILHRVPGAFALPTADPRAMAVETMLRITQTRYIKQDAHYRDFALDVPKAEAATSSSPAAAANGNGRKAGKAAVPYVTARGADAAMRGLSAALDSGVIANDQRAVVACVEALTTKCLFPAFVFLTYYDYSLYQYGIKKGVTPKVGTLWESFRGTFRMNTLRENPYFYGDVNAGRAPPTSRSPSLTQLGVMEAVLAEVMSALQSLELLHVAHASVGGSFFLGTARPCSVDGYAYAGVSAFLHGNFCADPTTAASPTNLVLSPLLAKCQERIRDECPLLVKYAERVRTLLYEDCSSTYNLRPAVLAEAIESTAAVQATHDLYANGRLRSLLWTAAFATLYFLVANADLLAAMAEELVEALEEEEEEVEGQQAAAAQQP